MAAAAEPASPAGTRVAGRSLAAAAALFWVSWLLMPGVGVTDPARILDLVSSQRSLVAASVVVQLVSAVLYVPAIVGIVADASATGGVRRAAGVLLAGAMGSAADAVLHLLAYAMTAPGLDRAPLLAVMAFMQGPGLGLLMPLVAAFFAGGAWLSRSLAACGLVPRAAARLHAVAFAIAVAGGIAASRGLVAPRVVGLAFLGLVGAAQAWTGLALAARADRA